MSINKMTVFIERLVGENLMLEPVQVEEGDKVYSLKEMIFDKLAIEPYQQELSFQDQMMKDDNTMAFYNIKEGSIIHLVVLESGEDFMGTKETGGGN